MLTFGAMRRANALEVGIASRFWFRVLTFGAHVFSRLVHDDVWCTRVLTFGAHILEIWPCLHAVGVLFEAGAKQAYETISFAVVKVPA